MLLSFVFDLLHVLILTWAHHESHVEVWTAETNFSIFFVSVARVVSPPAALSPACSCVHFFVFFSSIAGPPPLHTTAHKQKKIRKALSSLIFSVTDWRDMKNGLRNALRCMTHACVCVCVCASVCVCVRRVCMKW